MQYKYGDITKASEIYIAHGCNAAGVMGAGVAKAMRDAFPMNYEDYKHRCNRENDAGRDIFGTYLGCPEKNNKFIVNLITHDFANGSSLKAIKESLDMFCHDLFYFGETADAKIAIPKIGTGIGRLPWKAVEGVLLGIEHDWSVEFVVYHLDNDDAK